VSEGQASVASCPKCGKKRASEAESCPRCGLVFALWKAEDGLALASLDETGQALWQKLASNWSDPASHEELLKHCLLSNTLAAAGRLYRDRLDQDPKDTIAAQMQSQVLAKATLHLSITKTQPRPAFTRSTWFWIVILVALALGIFGGLFWRRIR
jgi:hypothetical protein